MHESIEPGYGELCVRVPKWSRQFDQFYNWWKISNIGDPNIIITNGPYIERQEINSKDGWFRVPGDCRYYHKGPDSKRVTGGVSSVILRSGLTAPWRAAVIQLWELISLSKGRKIEHPDPSFFPDSNKIHVLIVLSKIKFLSILPNRNSCSCLRLNRIEGPTGSRTCR